MYKRRNLLLIAFLLLALIVSGCGGTQTAQPQEPKQAEQPKEVKEKKLIVAQPRDVTTLDSGMVSNSEVNNISMNIGDRLVEMDVNYKYVPGLATSWENPDPLTWRFRLRQGIKFHNGEDFNAESVKCTFDRILDPANKSAQAGRFGVIKEVKIIDPYTVDLVTSEPFAPLLNYLNAVVMVPPKYVKEVGNEQFGKKPIGTGAFEFVEMVPGERVVLKANKNYWKGAPKIDTLVFRPISETATRIAALQTGEVDIIASLPPDRLADIENDPNLASTTKLTNMLYLGLDALNPPMNDVRVRRAINHAINVEPIIKNILKGTAKPMVGPYFESTFGRDPELQRYPYDPEKAKALLAEAGYPNGFETVLSTPPQGVEGTTNTLEVAQAIAQQLGDVGIKVKLDITDPATQFQRYRDKEFKMYLFTWDEQQEPDRYLYTLFHSKARGYYYMNPTQVDPLLEKGRSTLDWAEREKIYKQLHKVLLDDAAWGYLYSQMAYYGYNKRVVGFEAPHDGQLYFWNVDKEM